MGSNNTVKICKNSLTKDYPTKEAKLTTMSFKNFKRAINFHKKENLPCKDIWKTSIFENHIRNKNLRDLPFAYPKCCSDVYNIVLDRQKLKKLQLYNMSRLVRSIESDLETEKKSKLIPNTNCSEPSHQVYECGTCDYEDDKSDGNSFETCESGSLVDCTGCDTLGGGQTLKRHLKKKKTFDWKFLRNNEIKNCRKLIIKEITKYKGNKNAKLNLKNYSSI